MRRLWHFYADGFRGLPRGVWLVSAAALVNRAGTMVFPFLSLYLAERMGLASGQIALVLFAFGLGSVAGSYAGGWLCDRIGAIEVQLLSFVGGGFAFLAVSTLRGVTALAIGAFVLSLVADAFRPAVMTSVAELAPPERRARAMALLRLAVNLGFAAGPALGGLLAARSYGWLFLADALTCWVAALLLWLTMRGALPGQAAIRAACRRTGAPFWRDLPFLALLVVALLLSIGIFQVFSTMPVYLHDAYLLDESAIGLVLGFNALLVVLLEMPLVRLVERRDHVRVIGFGSVLFCLGIALLPWGASFAFVLGTVLVWSIGEMLALPLLNTVVAARAADSGEGAIGRYMGAYGMVFSLATMLAPVIGFGIYGRWGGLTLWSAVGLTGLLLWPACLLLARPLRGA